MRPGHLPVFIALMVILSSSGCRKNGSPGAALFYGAWKTSYGDTVLFARNAGKNILSMDNSMNPSMPMITQSEFTYIGGKLAVKWNYNPSGSFRPYQTFAWVQQGKEFSIQGVEWFSFLSSTLTIFTFTKIQ
jgi:hypothetical protein